MCHIEMKRALGLKHQRAPSKPRKPPQHAEDRERIRVEFEGALAIASNIEATAGATLRKELERPKRFQQAFGVAGSRKDARVRRLGQRKGLLALLQCETHQDFPHELNDRSRLYVKHMLQITANVVVLEGSDWDGALSWFDRTVPALVSQIGADMMRAEFEAYVGDVAMVLAGRVQGGPQTFITGPTPVEIAQDLQITTEQLRYAEANRCGLTSIDPESKRDRDRRYKERERRAKGVNTNRRG